MTPTFEQVKEVVGNVRGLKKWYDAMVFLAPKYDINTPERWAGFLSQVVHESGSFKYVKENMNYSAKRLNEVFWKYFEGAGRDARAYARKPEAIANIVYANRLGNGDTESGDGWNYRGRGIIQLTGRNNYRAFAKSLNATLDDVVEYLETTEGAVESAMWYWDVNNINKKCDQKSIEAITKAVNGGDNGLEERRAIWEKALDVFGSKEEKTARTDFYAELLSMGDRGEEVKKLQHALGIVADGIFGPNTKRAVKEYQRRNGLIPDGVVGPRTFAKITEG